jgi:Uma2 family endonuclease
MTSAATHDDLLKVPDHLVAEIVDGELFTSPRPASPHAFATGALLLELTQTFQRGRGEWWFLFQPELHLGNDVLVPDIAGWRKERMPFVPDVDAFTLAPDWICEMVSPLTTRLDRDQKLPRYARYGVGHAWLVDPLERTIEVYRSENEHWSFVSTREPFDEAAIDLGELWLPQS